MKKVINVEVEGYGKVRLDNEGDYYTATDNNGNFLGEVYPDEIDGWDESDDNIMSSIIEDLIDDGTLEVSLGDGGFYDDYDE